MIDSLKCLEPLMLEKAAIRDLIHFHHSINTIYHDIESSYYDSLHREMWDSLQLQYNRLAKKALDKINLPTAKLSLLDIGAGTGLSTEFLLNTELANCIEHITLLDTSSQMLKKAKKRSRQWNKKVDLIHGDVSKAKGHYDIVLMSSVLHHIPDIPQLLNQINEIQQPGDIFMHIHDPNYMALNSTAYMQRCKQYSEFRLNEMKGITLQNVLRKVWNRIKRLSSFQQEEPVISKTNKALRREGIIIKDLTAAEIYSVTDIHVEGLPYAQGKGINLDDIGGVLSNYKLLHSISYAFFGVLESHLDEVYKQKEAQLSTNNDMEGRNMGCIWQKQF